MTPRRRIAFLAGAAAVALPTVAVTSTRAGQLDEATTVVRITVATEMRGAPDPEGKVVAKIPVGRVVDVLGRRGRWVEVRHRGRHGWLLRSALDTDVVTPELVRNARAWAGAQASDNDTQADEDDGGKASPPRRRRWSQRDPTARSTSNTARAAATTADRRADREHGERAVKPAAASAFAPVKSSRKPAKGNSSAAPLHKVRRTEVAALEVAEPDERLAAEELEDDLAEVDDAVEVGDGGHADPLAVPSLRAPARRTPKTFIEMRASGGYTATGMVRTSASGDGAALSRFAGPSTEIGVRASHALGPIRVGVDGELLWAFGGALRHQSTTTEVRDTEAREMAATGALTVGGGHELRAAGRAGYHYGQIAIAKVDNLAQLPSEILSGPTLGLEAGASLGPVDVGIVVDFLIKGSVEQVAGLEDGVAGSPFSGVGRAEVRYRLGHHLAVSARYRLHLARATYSGDSIRLPGTADTSRSDQSHSALVGLNLGL